MLNLRAIPGAFIVIAAACAVTARPLAQAPVDPFAFLAPTVSVTPDERKRLEAGEAVLRTIEAASGELAVFGATRIRADGERLTAWIRRVEELKRSERVPLIERFSKEPRLEDLGALSLDPGELSDVRACRPGRCDLKLTASEIAALQKSMLSGTGVSDDRLQAMIREFVLERVRRYARGEANASPDVASMMDRSAFLGAAAPSLTRVLMRGPQDVPEHIESFLYWSIEDLGAKPVLSATHVGIAQPFSERHPEVMVASRQIFATHYFDGALNVTMVTRSHRGGPRYLIFVNRSSVDVLGGLLGGVRRFVVERRLRGDGQELLEALRERIESGIPGT